MKRLAVYCLLLTAFILSGCTTRVISYKVDRVDQEKKGNRGVVGGELPSSPETQIKKTRTMYKIEVELPSRRDTKRSKKAKRVIRGNRGYIERAEVMKIKGPVEEQKGAVTLEALSSPDTPQVIYPKPAKKKDVRVIKKGQKAYTVKKGDTLQKISNKMYGTTKRWRKIFEANKKALKTPDMIRPGQKLMIPMD